MVFVNVNIDGVNEQQQQQQQQQPNNRTTNIVTSSHDDELEMARNHIRILSQQNDVLQSELQQLKSNNMVLSSIYQNPEHSMSVVTVNQLSTYQNALAISESQKQAIQHENQMLRSENVALRRKLEQLGVSFDPSTLGVVDMNVNMDLSMSMMDDDNDDDENEPVGEGGRGGSVSSLMHHRIHHHHHVDPPPLDITTEEALAAIEQHHHQHNNPNHTNIRHNPHEQDNDDDDDDDDNNQEAAEEDLYTTGLPSRTEEKWDRQLERLQRYKQEHGNCLVPTNTELGRWLSRQRNNFMNHTLKEDRRIRLEQIDSTCLGERLSDLPSASTGMTTTTAGVFVPLSTPVARSTEDDTKNQHSERNIITIQSKTKYNQEYEEKLHEKWNVFFSQLVEYHEKTGHANFPTMHGSLGRWISRQRTLYRQSKLKADRYAKLKDIGFVFEDATADEFQSKNDEAWMEMFQMLQEHKQNKGHCFDIPENSRLGKWLYRQRWMYRKGNLREDRAEKLLAIGFEERKYDHPTNTPPLNKASYPSGEESHKNDGSSTKRKRRKHELEVNRADSMENTDSLNPPSMSDPTEEVAV